MRPLFVITTIIIATVIGMGASLLLSARARSAMEKREAEKQLLEDANHLVGFALTLRASEEVRRKKLAELESERLQRVLQGLWNLRHESEEINDWAIAVHEYLQKHKVPLDEKILPDPVFRKPSLREEE